MTYHIGGVAMKLPIMVGAGVCKNPESVIPYMREDVSVGAVSTGSYTPDFSPGNEGTLFYPENYSEFTQNGFGLNSFGMPNMGFEAAAKEIHKRYLHPVIVSVAGFRVEDFVLGVKVFDAHPGIAAIKLNLGCPNRKEKPVPIAYDLDLLIQILKAIGEARPQKPLWLKLSPYITVQKRDELQAKHPHIDFSHVPVTSPEFLGTVLCAVLSHGFVRAIVFSNTLPNVIVRNASGNPVTTPNGGKAGLSGSILKPISLNLIRQAATMLSGAVDLIASGGILHGDDAVDAFESKANAVFYASGPFWSGNGPRFSADFISGSERLQNYLSKHSHDEEKWPCQ